MSRMRAGSMVTAAAVAAAVIAASLAALMTPLGDAAGAQPPPAPQQVVLRPGDTMRVEGADIGCQVARRDARPSVECRRLSGPARGAYMTILTSRGAMVARFRSARTAKVVFTARHGGGARLCQAAAAAAAKQPCR